MLQLSIGKALGSRIFGENNDALEIILHPSGSDIQLKHQGVLKIDVLGLINNFYASNFFEIVLNNGINTHTLSFQKQALPKYSKSIYGMATAKANAKVLYQELINCLRASFLGEQYVISGKSSWNDLIFYIEFESKYVGSNYNLNIKAYDDSARTTNIWDGSITASWYNIIQQSADATNSSNKIWIKILHTMDGTVWKEVYKEYSNIGIAKNDKWVYRFEGVPFILRSFLAFNAFSDAYSIARATSQSAQFKVQYWVEYNSTVDYIYEDAIDIKEVLKVGTASFEAPLNLENKSLNTKIYNIIAPHQPAWFSILRKNKNNAMKVRYISKENTTLKTVDIPEAGADNMDGIVHIPAWLSYDANWLDTESLLLIQFIVGNSIVYTYYIDYTYMPNEKWLYFFNSLGGVDSVRLQNGKGDSYMLSFNEYQTSNNGAQTTSWRTLYQIKNQSNTDNVDSYLAEFYKELIRSVSIYEIESDTVFFPTLPMPRLGNSLDIPYKMERYGNYAMINHPVLITTKDVGFSEVSNNLFSVKIDYVRAKEESSAQNTKPVKQILRNDFIDFCISNVFAPQILKLKIRGINIRTLINGVEVAPKTASGIDSVWSEKILTFDLLPNSNVNHIAIRVEAHLTSAIEISVASDILVLDSRFESIKSVKIYGLNSKKSLSHLVKKYGPQEGLNLELPDMKQLNMDDVFMDMLHFLGKNATVDVRNTPAIGLSGHASEIGNFLTLERNIIIQHD